MLINFDKHFKTLININTDYSRKRGKIRILIEKKRKLFL